MSQERETNLALFIDFDNVALGARDAGQRFDIKLLIQRVLEKGKIIVKKSYADWHYYKEYMSPLHEAAIELIEIPMPKISGKNSADIKLVVDAMDLCYSKDHIDTFVIVSGDSDFSPLVSKLRENNKRVIGIGMKNSSSRLLIGNCDEFIFYDDIIRQRVGRLSKSSIDVPSEKRELFDFLVKTVQSLLMESRGVLYSSLIKDTMTRKQPDFNERGYGYSTFGDLLEEARGLGLLDVERDAAAGGTWVVRGLGKGISLEKAGNGGSGGSGGSGRPSRRRRRSSRGGQRDGKDAAVAVKPTEMKPDKPAAGDAPRQADVSEGKPETPKAPSAKKINKKPVTKKAVTKKAPPKKAPVKKSPEKKTVTKKAPAKKAPEKKPVTRKAPTKKAPAKKAAKKVTRKTDKAPAKKVTKKAAPKKSGNR